MVRDAYKVDVECPLRVRRDCGQCHHRGDHHVAKLGLKVVPCVGEEASRYPGKNPLLIQPADDLPDYPPRVTRTQEASAAASRPSLPSPPAGGTRADFPAWLVFCRPRVR